MPYILAVQIKTSVPPIDVDSAEALQRDVAAITRIGIVPAILKLACDQTGMGFAAVARVTEDTWTACAVEDRIGFGLRPGEQLSIETTLCREARALRQPIVFDHADQDPIYRGHHTSITYNIQSYISVPIVRPDGYYFGNLCAIDPNSAYVSDAKTVGMITALADMIAFQLSADDVHAETQLVVQSQRETAELREQFIAVLGHDLRNPLDAIGMTAQLLVRRPDEQDRKLGEQLRASTRRMTDLIDNVLDFARARLGSGIGAEIRTADALSSAFSAVIEESRIAHPEADIRQDIDISIPVECDSGKLQQLLSNLLGNALHHGSQEEPVLVSANAHNGILELSVCNSGARIQESDLKQIFQPYWRPSNSKPGGGLGLGLYICSEIVKAHSGTLTALSTADGKTSFAARMPIGRAR